MICENLSPFFGLRYSEIRQIPTVFVFSCYSTREYSIFNKSIYQFSKKRSRSMSRINFNVQVSLLIKDAEH